MLEVLVALAIVGTTGLSVLGLLASGVRAGREDAAREQTLSRAERTIAAYALLGREDLDRRIGKHPVGEVIVSVQRPERALYRVAVALTESEHVEELVTVLYRPEATSAP